MAAGPLPLYRHAWLSSGKFPLYSPNYLVKGIISQFSAKNDFCRFFQNESRSAFFRCKAYIIDNMSSFENLKMSGPIYLIRGRESRSRGFGAGTPYIWALRQSQVWPMSLDLGLAAAPGAWDYRLND
jgi:hypothetical protein